MDPSAVTAWIQVAQILANIGIDVAGKIKGIFKAAHPDLTDAQVQQAYDALMADATVREALARQAAGQTPTS